MKEIQINDKLSELFIKTPKNEHESIYNAILLTIGQYFQDWHFCSLIMDMAEIVSEELADMLSEYYNPFKSI